MIILSNVVLKVLMLVPVVLLGAVVIKTLLVPPVDGRFVLPFEIVLLSAVLLATGQILTRTSCSKHCSPSWVIPFRSRSMLGIEALAAKSSSWLGNKGAPKRRRECE